MKKAVVIFTFLMLICLQIFSQPKVKINDNVGILNDRVLELVSNNLSRSGLTYSSFLDFESRCDYYFVNLHIKDGEAFIHVLDCNSVSVGGKDLGSHFLQASPEEISIILSFAIIDEIKTNLPNKKWKWDPYHQTVVKIREGKYIADTQKSITNEHSSRYFFAPTAYNIKRGELYYNSIYFLVHDIQYGITNRFSFGMGTTIAALPFYFTPKFTIPITKKSAFAFGNIMIMGTWGVDFFGNLAYGMFTVGNDNSFSIGSGWLTTSESDYTAKTNSQAFNFSTILRVSDFVYFVSENYTLNVNFNHFAEFGAKGTAEYQKADFVHKQNFIFGISGLRFVNKKNNVICWQVGLTYIVDFLSDIPGEYLEEGWRSSIESGGIQFYAIPTLNYTHKFGKKF